jgi:hypothetical protein
MVLNAVFFFSFSFAERLHVMRDWICGKVDDDGTAILCWEGGLSLSVQGMLDVSQQHCSFFDSSILMVDDGLAVIPLFNWLCPSLRIEIGVAVTETWLELTLLRKTRCLFNLFYKVMIKVNIFLRTL